MVTSRGLKDEEKHKIVQLRMKEHSIVEISQTIGRSTKLISQFLKLPENKNLPNKVPSRKNKDVKPVVDVEKKVSEKQSTEFPNVKREHLHIIKFLANRGWTSKDILSSLNEVYMRDKSIPDYEVIKYIAAKNRYRGEWVSTDKNGKLQRALFILEAEKKRKERAEAVKKGKPISIEPQQRDVIKFLTLKNYSIPSIEKELMQFFRWNTTDKESIKKLVTMYRSKKKLSTSLPLTNKSKPKKSNENGINETGEVKKEPKKKVNENKKLVKEIGNLLSNNSTNSRKRSGSTTSSKKNLSSPGNVEKKAKTTQSRAIKVVIRKTSKSASKPRTSGGISAIKKEATKKQTISKIEKSPKKDLFHMKFASVNKKVME